MATPGIPQNFVVQTANRTNLVSWALSVGATAYIVQRSLDNVTFTTVAMVSGSPLATSYLDAAANLTSGTQYWYKTAASSQVGYVTFTGNPNNLDTISINNVSFMAVTSGATGFEFNIGTTPAATIVNLAAVINASIPGMVAAGTSSTQLILGAFSSTVTNLASALTNTVVIPFTTGGTSAYTTPQSVVPTQTGEMSLGAIRLAAMQRADRVNSNFVTTEEWGNYINQSMYELYDLLTTVYEDYNIATPISFTSDGITFNYPLPDGVLTYTNGLTNQPGFVAPSFYKLMGVDLALNNVNNAYVTINKYNFIDRNRYVYPNTSSTLYGVFNCQYRLFGNNIQFIPTPTSGQVFRIWYIPRLTELIQDKDVTTIGISGWIEYVIVKAAYYALTKEESDTSSLVMQLQALNTRIEQSAANRDAGQPDTISDTRNGSSYPWGSGSGFNGSSGGW